MSRSKLAILLMIAAVFISACGGSATPTPRPTVTSAPVEATEQAAEPTEEATELATEEVATEEATEVATEEVATEEATVEVAMVEPTEEPTVEATEEVATEEATVEVTEEVATEEPTEEVAVAPTIEVTLEVTDEATVEATLEATEEAATEEPTEEATVEATEEAAELTAVTAQLQGDAQAGYAAFYVADEQGLYADADLDVTWESGSDEVELADGATFGVADAYDVLVAIQGGADLVIIGFFPSAAMMDMSAMMEVTVEADATVDADATVEVPSVDMGSVGSGYLAIYTSGEWLAEEGSEAVAVSFLRATIAGWGYCAENSSECLDIVGESVDGVTEADLAVIAATAGMTGEQMSMSVAAQWDVIVGGALAADTITEEPAAESVRLDLFEAAFSPADAEMGTSESTVTEATAEATTEATAEATP